MGHYRFEDIAYNITDKKMPEPGDEKTYVGLEHLDSGSLSVSRWGSAVEITGQKLVMRKGDVLFGRRNTYLRRAAIAPHDGIFSAHGMIFRPKTNIIDADFFPFFIASDYFIDEAIRISVGSLSPTVNWGTLKNLEFNLPSMENQQEMARLLTAANDAKEAYKKLLVMTDELVKSQFIEMFGDPVTNSMGWPFVKLSDCLTSIDSGTSLNCENFCRKGSEPAVLKLSAVTYGVYQSNENKKIPNPNSFIDKEEVHQGDLLFSRKNTREYVGMSAYVYETPEKLMLPDLIFRLNTNDKCNRIFLWKLINHDKFRYPVTNLASGTASSMPNISKQRLMNLEIPLPPLCQQEHFADFVLATDKSIFELRQTLDSLENMIRALINASLS